MDPLTSLRAERSTLSHDFVRVVDMSPQVTLDEGFEGGTLLPQSLNLVTYEGEFEGLT
jgi:hypothetical protein